MRDYERKIKEQAKKEVKNFDLWYKNNELKLINSKIYPSYYATKQLEKPKFRKGWWYACVVTSLFLLIAGLLFRGNNLINNNIFLDENIFFPITQSNNAIYNNKLENEFDILMQSEMGFKLSYDEMKSFYVVLSGEEDLFLYGVKSEIKTLQDKYFLTFYFPERYSDIKNKADFKDLKEKVNTDRYDISYKIEKLSDGTYLYNMKVDRRNYGTSCFLEVRSTYNKLGDFLTTIF